MRICFIFTIIFSVVRVPAEAKDNPYMYVNLGFGFLKTTNDWIKSYSLGLNQDLTLTKRSSFTFGVLYNNFKLNTEFDVDTTSPNIANVDNYNRKSNLNYNATSLHFTFSYKYWLKKSENVKFYVSCGLSTNMIIQEHYEYDYYYQDWSNLFYRGPLHVDNNYTPDNEDRLFNLVRPILDFGVLKKIGPQLLLHLNVELTQSMRHYEAGPVSFLYPRFGIGLAF